MSKPYVTSKSIEYYSDKSLIGAMKSFKGSNRWRTINVISHYTSVKHFLSPPGPGRPLYTVELQR